MFSVDRAPRPLQRCPGLLDRTILTTKPHPPQQTLTTIDSTLRVAGAMPFSDTALKSLATSSLRSKYRKRFVPRILRGRRLNFCRARAEISRSSDTAELESYKSCKRFCRYSIIQFSLHGIEGRRFHPALLNWSDVALTPELRLEPRHLPKRGRADEAESFLLPGREGVRAVRCGNHPGGCSITAYRELGVALENDASFS